MFFDSHLREIITLEYKCFQTARCLSCNNWMVRFKNSRIHWPVIHTFHYRFTFPGLFVSHNLPNSDTEVCTRDEVTSGRWEVDLFDRTRMCRCTLLMDDTVKDIPNVNLPGFGASNENSVWWKSTQYNFSVVQWTF